MKKLLLFLIPLFLLSCTTTRYLISLSDVEEQNNLVGEYGSSQIVVDKEITTSYSYDDSLINVIWLMDKKGLNFQLTNKTIHSMRINWIEVVYIGPNNTSHKVKHSGIRLPSIIPKNSSLNDYILPIRATSLNPKADIGKTIKVLLPIQIENTINEYLFIFDIKDVFVITY